MTPLETLKDIANRLEAARDGFTLHKERWYSWNYWAKQHREQYATWFDSHKDVQLIDILAFWPYECDVKFDWNEGHRYVSAWKGANKAIADLEKEFDKQLELCEQLRMQGEYTRADIAEALGRKIGATNKLINTRKWKSSEGGQDAS